MEESTDGPSSEDWALAVLALRMIDDLADEVFRQELGRLAVTLTNEGLAAHRTADHLENRSAFTTTLSPSDHELDAILAKISESCGDRHWMLIGAYVGQLGSTGLDDPDRLRQQAAAILDAAQFLHEIVQWYEVRRASIGTHDLTNDTIISIMLDWKVQPTDTVRQLEARGYHVASVGALANALLRHRQREEAGVGAEAPGPMQVLMRRWSGSNESQ